jgi:hypothetical protein
MVIYASTDIEVIHTVTATGVETTLTEGTGATKYSVGLTSYPATGSITYPADEVTPIPSTETITIKRVLPYTQLIDLTTQGPYSADTQEVALDKLTIMILQLQEQLDRAILIPVGSSVGFVGDDTIPVADTYLKMDTDLNGVSWAEVTTTSTSASNTAPLGVSLTAAAAGSAGAFARDDHVHLLPTVSIAKGGTGAVTAAAALDAIGVDGVSAVLATGDYADNSVTLAKMAGGTDGNLIGIDANGNPAYIATGTSGQVLRSNGVGAAATFDSSTGELVIPKRTVAGSVVAGPGLHFGTEPSGETGIGILTGSENILRVYIQDQIAATFGANGELSAQTFFTDGAITIADNAVHIIDQDDADITFDSNSLMMFGTSVPNTGGIVGFRLQSPEISIIAQQAETTSSADIGATLVGTLEVTTGVLAGTTGTNGKLTISVDDTNNAIYIENRRGASLTLYYMFVGGGGTGVH